MEKYTYLLLGLLVVAPLIGILFARKDLAGKAIKLGALGGFAGLLAEFFYFRDYWRPPSLMGTATISVEDFIFGFAITALSFTAYTWLFKAKFIEQAYPSRHKLYLLFFVGGLAAMVLFNLHLGVNSIFVSSAVFLFFTAIILFMRRDLIKVGLYSAGIVTAFIGAVYILLFNVISPQFWDKYWLLADTKWGITILGNVPLTEMIWYVSWIVFASVSYPFVSGKAIHQNERELQS